MSLARHSFLANNETNENEILYQKACDENEVSREMGHNEFLKIFSYKLNIPIQTFFESEILEKKVLQLARTTGLTPTIPHDINIKGRAQWFVHQFSYALDYALVIKYVDLTCAQRSEMCNAFNQTYGPIAMTYEDYYQGVFCKENQNGILFNKSRFCQFILPALINQPILDEQDNKRFDIRFAVYNK